MLIGASRYKKLSALPSVKNNLSALSESLCDPRVWGLARTHCTVVPDPKSNAAMLDPVKTAAEEATDTLLLYYAGHGLIDAHRGELHLALVGSDPDRIYAAVAYDQVRDELLRSRAGRRIVILDCCYRGRALGLMSGGGVSALLNEASAEGTYVMAATAENKAALAPPDETYTAFTAELLQILQNGLPDRDELLELSTIFNHISAAMAMKSRPVPQMRARNTAGQLKLVRNRAHSAQKSVFGKQLDPDDPEVKRAMAAFMHNMMEANRPAIMEIIKRLRE